MLENSSLCIRYKMIGNQDIKDWAIYKITSPSNKVYIGKTSNLYNRYSNYKNFEVAKQVQKQRILYFSLKKYGFEAHKFEILDEFTSNSDYCSGKEMFWIRSYMANVCRYPELNGMNLTDGGEGNLGWKRPEESRLEIIRKNKGRKRSEESRKRMSESMKGNKNGCGKILSEEHKQILSESGKKRKGDEGFKRKCKDRAIRMNREAGKSVIYLNDKGDVLKEFDFIYEAASFFNVTENAVRRRIKGIGVSKKINAILKYRKDIQL